MPIDPGARHKSAPLSKPFALSLSKGRTSLRAQRLKKKRPFDKLRANGLHLWRGALYGALL